MRIHCYTLHYLLVEANKLLDFLSPKENSPVSCWISLPDEHNGITMDNTAITRAVARVASKKMIKQTRGFETQIRISQNNLHTCQTGGPLYGFSS
jgi:hypothetical protein